MKAYSKNIVRDWSDSCCGVIATAVVATSRGHGGCSEGSVVGDY